MKAGSTSHYNEALETDFVFSFQTPTVKILHTYPPSGGRYVLNTPMAIVFNQQINPEEILETISISLSQENLFNKLMKKTYASVQMLSKRDIEQDKELQSFLTNYAKDGCWVAFCCARDFLYESTVTVKIEGNVGISFSIFFTPC